MTIKTWAQLLETVTSRHLRTEPHPEIYGRHRDWFCCAVGEKLQLPKPEHPDEADEAQQILDSAIEKVSRRVHHLGKLFPRLLEKPDAPLARATVEAINIVLTPEIIEKIRKQYVKDRQFMRRASWDLKGTLERELGI